MAPIVKNPPANSGNKRVSGSIPGLGRSSGKGHGNPLQYSCLENPMDRGAWQTIARRVSRSWIQLKWLSMYACGILYWLLGKCRFVELCSSSKYWHNSLFQRITLLISSLVSEEFWILRKLWSSLCRYNFPQNSTF